MTHFYAVVYGDEWEDIVYYNDFVKAQTKHMWSVLDIEKLHIMDKETVATNPSIAFELIDDCV
jgi:hypothetical protein